MASSPAHIFSAEDLAKWEKLYNLLGRGYAFIADHPETEAEIRIMLTDMKTSSIEGTELEREYRIFPTIFTNFLEAYNRADQEVILASIVRARYQDRSDYLVLANFVADNHRKAVEYANEQVSLLVRERENLVERLALSQTVFEQDPRNIMLRFQCTWLEDRLDDLTMDIARGRALVRDLELEAEYHDVKVAELKEKCNLLLFKLVDLDSRSARCRQSIISMENQLNSFVMLIRAQFGFTFPPR